MAGQVAGHVEIRPAREAEIPAVQGALAEDLPIEGSR